MSKQKTLEEFRKIPGVGESIANDLWDLDIHSIKDLKKQNPDRLYNKFCAQKNMQVDRCMLYVFRCATYYVCNDKHDPKLLKWWNWKNNE
ncbi:MAG: helix-hairpin-helix domain-containing protein [Candidatus Micrarchaeota archaeon]